MLEGKLEEKNVIIGLQLSAYNLLQLLRSSFLRFDNPAAPENFFSFYFGGYAAKYSYYCI